MRLSALAISCLVCLACAGERAGSPAEFRDAGDAGSVVGREDSSGGETSATDDASQTSGSETPDRPNDGEGHADDEARGGPVNGEESSSNAGDSDAESDASAMHENPDVGLASSDAAPNDGSVADDELTPGDAASDEGSSEDVRDASDQDGDSGDSGPTDDASTTAQCRPERTTTVPGGEPIEVGVFCDVVFLCATPEQASRAKLLAPDFECKGATGEYGCGQQVCELLPSAQDRRLLQEEYEQVCALSSLDVARTSTSSRS